MAVDQPLDPVPPVTLCRMRSISWSQAQIWFQVGMLGDTPYVQLVPISSYLSKYCLRRNLKPHLTVPP